MVNLVYVLDCYVVDGIIEMVVECNSDLIVMILYGCWGVIWVFLGS